MTTTSLIVEILVIGLIGSIWVVLLLFGLSLVEPKSIIGDPVNLKEWSGLITIGVLGLVYQLGWLINGLSYGIFSCFGKKIRKNIFGEKNYNFVRGVVFQKASDKVRIDLDMERSIIRLSRSGVLNFGLIFISLLINGAPFIKALITVVLSIGCCFLWNYRLKRYYGKMIDFYEVIIQEEPRPNSTNSSQKETNKKES